MKLYFSKGSCSLAIRIILHEIGINADYEAVNLKTKETETGENYLTINPKGSVPAIVDNGEFITENNVIQQYLADKNNKTELLPPVGNIKRYRVLEWSNYVSTELHKGCSPLFNPMLPQEVKNTIFIPVLKNKLTYVDKQLAKNKYLTGENFTLPDAYLFVILSWLPKFEISITEWPSMAAYFEQLKQRKSVKDSLKEEGLQ